MSHSSAKHPSGRIGVIVSFALLATSAVTMPTSTSAQGLTVCGPLGALLGGLGATSAEASWQKVDPEVRRCVAQKAGATTEQLGQQCITPNDQRVSALVQSCVASVKQDSLAREKVKRDQAAAEEARQKADARARDTKLAAEVAAKEKKEARRRDLVAKYGDKADAILAGQILLGMTKQEVFESRGNPRGRDVVPPTDEMWRYDSGRIVFTDGKVTYLDSSLSKASAGQ